MLNQSSPEALYDRLALMEKLNAELLEALRKIVEMEGYVTDGVCIDEFIDFSKLRTAIANAEKALEDRS